MKTIHRCSLVCGALAGMVGWFSLTARGAPVSSAPALGDLRQVGTVTFPTSCAAEVRGDFARAVALLHSFFYEEARRLFTDVARRDAGCGIAHWGVAMTWIVDPELRRRRDVSLGVYAGPAGLRRAPEVAPDSEEGDDRVVDLDDREVGGGRPHHDPERFAVAGGTGDLDEGQVVAAGKDPDPVTGDQVATGGAPDPACERRMNPLTASTLPPKRGLPGWRR